PGFKGRWEMAPSAARVIYRHYGEQLLHRYAKLVDETDKMDAARLTMEDVTDPKGYILLGCTIDSRTGLAAYRGYFVKLVGWLRGMKIEQVLHQPEVMERIDKLQKSDAAFKEALKSHSYVDGNIVITDFRPLKEIPIGNRFLIYTLFPQCTVSVRLQWGPARK